MARFCMMEKVKKRVCVIGCGPSGMSMLLQLGKLPDDEIPDIVCYEKQDTLGGLWNVTWRTGLDQYGEPSHSSMYYDLWINNPTCNNEYPDYTYEKHFGKVLPSYAPRAVVRDYIEGRFTRTSNRDLQQYIRYSTAVRRVEYNKDTDDFTVISKNLKEDKENTERFTHVVVASGLFTVPKTPEIPGMDSFKGRVVHAKEVRHIDEFKNQRVLVIGSFISAEDLSVLLIKFGAKDVIISYKYRPQALNWPEGISERPLVVKVQGNTAFFKEGTEADVDAIIFATGYRLELPFMSEELRLKSDMLFYPENLYKGILWINGGNDKLMYIGLIYNVFHFNVYEAQAIWACRNIIGKIQLPSRGEMQADIDIWTNKVKEATKNHDFGQTFGFIEEYFRYMIETVGYNKDVLKLQEVFHTFLKHRSENPCTWRDKQFKSIYTGNTHPALSTPWMTNFDDKLEEFVNKY